MKTALQTHLHAVRPAPGPASAAHIIKLEPPRRDTARAAPGIVAMGVPSNPPCSPLNCDGCAKCQPDSRGHHDAAAEHGFAS